MALHAAKKALTDACIDGRPLPPRHARVNGDISDLFFNTDVSAAFSGDTESGYDAAKLEQEAMQFLASLGRLGVDVPTVDDLIADFHGRI